MTGPPRQRAPGFGQGAFLFSAVRRTGFQRRAIGGRMAPVADVTEFMQTEMPRQLRRKQHRPPVETDMHKGLSAPRPCGADTAAASPERALIPAPHRVHREPQSCRQLPQQRRQQHVRRMPSPAPQKRGRRRQKVFPRISIKKQLAFPLQQQQPFRPITALAP